MKSIKYGQLADSMGSIGVFFNGILIGRIIRIGVPRFVTERREEHFFRKYQGFGFNQELVESLLKKGISKIIVKYEDRETYLTSPREVKEEGNLYQAEGYEFQYIMPLRKMIDLTDRAEPPTPQGTL